MALLFIRFMFTPLGSSTKKRLHWHWDLKVFFFFFHSGGLKLVGSGSWSWNMWFILGLVRLVFQSHTIHFSAAVVPVPFWPSLVVVYPFEWLTAAQQQRLFVGKKPFLVLACLLCSSSAAPQGGLEKFKIIMGGKSPISIYWRELEALVPCYATKVNRTALQVIRPSIFWPLHHWLIEFQRYNSPSFLSSWLLFCPTPTVIYQN